MRQKCCSCSFKASVVLCFSYEEVARCYAIRIICVNNLCQLPHRTHCNYPNISFQIHQKWVNEPIFPLKFCVKCVNSISNSRYFDSVFLCVCVSFSPGVYNWIHSWTQWNFLRPFFLFAIKIKILKLSRPFARLKLFQHQFSSQINQCFFVCCS